MCRVLINMGNDELSKQLEELEAINKEFVERQKLKTRIEEEKKKIFDRSVAGRLFKWINRK